MVILRCCTVLVRCTLHGTLHGTLPGGTAWGLVVCSRWLCHQHFQPYLDPRWNNNTQHIAQTQCSMHRTQNTEHRLTQQYTDDRHNGQSSIVNRQSTEHTPQNQSSVTILKIQSNVTTQNTDVNAHLQLSIHRTHIWHENTLRWTTCLQWPGINKYK